MMNTNLTVIINRIRLSLEKQMTKDSLHKYASLYQAIKNCIINLELPEGMHLPSTRILADEMKLSRTTVIKAYELLLIEKLIESKNCSGYKVSYSPENTSNPKIETSKNYNAEIYPQISEKGEACLKNISLINRHSDANLAFRPGLPPLDIFPVNQWKKLTNSYWRYVKSSSLSYSSSSGIDSLKKNICNYLNITRNIKCSPHQVFIVSGSLQSLYLVSNVLLNKGDCVAMENPTFPNVHSIFKSMLANILPVNIDNEGIKVKELTNNHLATPKLVHTTPSNQYPFCVKMSLSRRLELLKWASESKALIIENDYESPVGNYQESIPSIYSIDKEDRTIYMSTFNRLLHPSIRLGYMIVPEYLVSPIKAFQEHSHRFVSPSVQLVMDQFIERNYLLKHLQHMIEVAQERRDLFISKLESQTSKLTIEHTPFRSLHVTAFLDNNLDESQVINLLRQNNIVVHSLKKCYVSKDSKAGLIFGYSPVPAPVLKEKVEKMAKIINSI
ncbi:PLP-dependent aminotransferase family protein [Plebeiibacterium sediminum]|uniref:PLP-dependent aminotransferase family protein n=1 Tax=Plebeiibacterium sediminum TaxID=2992112 RepID=A0AAE3M6S2_9BACT|nr:PLP-dependent aminotransferase family protein [Plebeiobacterium sediminum]MCW3788164.1 PLP-dependent aminotransferase family protein [Plebeiobacterium sediminum]